MKFWVCVLMWTLNVFIWVLWQCAGVCESSSATYLACVGSIALKSKKHLHWVKVQTILVNLKLIFLVN